MVRVKGEQCEGLTDKYALTICQNMECSFGRHIQSAHGKSMVNLSSDWVIKFNSLSRDSGRQGPYSPYEPCNHNLYIGIIIFPHNLHATVNTKKKDIKNETPKSEGTH